MASKRAILSASSQFSMFRAHQSRPVLLESPRTIPAVPQLKRAAQLSQVRWHSQPASNSKRYDFQDIKSMVDSPSEGRILIDVREPSEFKAGFIPSAINIPISSQPDALFLPDDEFEDRLGLPKPPKDKEVVFYCKAGVRSSSAAAFALQGGYQKVGEYRGSWLDWTKQGGKTQ
ncbi:MAG: hypothetical protein M1812_004033 [Candelaria pacifica]|nr:MAG: hypothetical protein M1812_004033 [Candelaria pacifica]